MTYIQKLLSKLSKPKPDMIEECLEKLRTKSITTNLKKAKAKKRSETPAKSKRTRLHNLPKSSKRPPHSSRKRLKSKGK